MSTFCNLKRANPRDTIRISELTEGYDFKCITGKYCIVDHIIKELLTPKRSYVFDPEFGSNIHKYVFNHIDESTVVDIVSEIKTITDKYSSVVSTEINYNYDIEKKIVTIYVELSTTDESYKLTLDMGKNVLVPTIEYVRKTL